MRHTLRYAWIGASVLGAAVLFWATWPYKAGVAPDSIIYLSMAHHLHAGKGAIVYLELFMDASQPIAAWPPLLAWVMGGLFAGGVDPLYSAWVLNGLLYGVNLALCGFLVFRCSRSGALALLVVLALALNTDWTLYHGWVLAEPLFLTVVNGGLFFLWRFLEFSKNRDLFAAALLTGLAPLTRYVGVAFIAAGAVCLLVLVRGPHKTRILKATLFSCVASVPLALWLARNYLITKTSAGAYAETKEVIFGSLVHRLTDSNGLIENATYAAKAFFVAFNKGVPLTIPGAIIFAVAAIAVFWAMAFPFGKMRREEERNVVDGRLPFALMVYGLFYQFTLITSLWFTRFYGGIPERYQFPSIAHFWCLFLLFIYFLYRSLGLQAGVGKKVLKAVIVAFCLMCVVPQAKVASDFFAHVRANGIDDSRGGRFRNMQKKEWFPTPQSVEAYHLRQVSQAREWGRNYLMTKRRFHPELRSEFTGARVAEVQLGFMQGAQVNFSYVYNFIRYFMSSQYQQDQKEIESIRVDLINQKNITPETFASFSQVTQDYDFERIKLELRQTKSSYYALLLEPSISPYRIYEYRKLMVEQELALARLLSGIAAQYEGRVLSIPERFLVKTYYFLVASDELAARMSQKKHFHTPDAVGLSNRNLNAVRVIKISV